MLWCSPALKCSAGSRAPSCSRRDRAVPFQSCIPPALSFLLNAALLSFVPPCQKTPTSNPDTKPLLPKPGSRGQASSIWCSSLCKTLLPNLFLLVTRNFTPQSELSSSFPGPILGIVLKLLPRVQQVSRTDATVLLSMLFFMPITLGIGASWMVLLNGHGLRTMRRKPTAGRDLVDGLSDLQGLF